jgi:hypothetical protein
MGDMIKEPVRKKKMVPIAALGNVFAFSPMIEFSMDRWDRTRQRNMCHDRHAQA